jgi:predicted DNA-binding transcriptional regulator YafY
MPANKNAVARYIILDRMLSDQHHYFTRTQLLNAVNDSLKGIDEALQVSKRTIEMDLRDMEDIFQIELDESKIINGKKVIRYVDQTRPIFSKPLSDDEKTLLHEVLSTLGQFSGLDNFEWLDDLKTKLASQLSFGGSQYDNDQSTPLRKVICFSSNEFLQNKEYLGWFFSAITNRKVVSITYRKFDAVSAQKIIAYPYMLKQYRDRWYLLCTPTCDKTLPYNPHFIANIPLDRIEAFEEVQNIPYVDCQVDIDELFDDIVGVTYYWDKPVEHVVFAVHKSSANFIRTKPIHPYQAELTKEDQAVLRRENPKLEDYSFFSLDCKLNYELSSLFRSYGPNLIVLSPNTLREEMKENARRQIELYS